MTGLDLESFLLLLRADLGLGGLGAGERGARAFGLVVLGLAASSGKCLVLSLAAHLGLVLCGSTIPCPVGRSRNPADAAQRPISGRSGRASGRASGPQGGCDGGSRGGGGWQSVPTAGGRVGAAAALPASRPALASLGRRSRNKPARSPGPCVPGNRDAPGARSLPEPVPDGPRGKSPSSSGGAARPPGVPPNLAEVDRAASATRHRRASHASRVAPVQERSSRPWGLGIGRSARTRACAPDDPRKRPTPRDLDPQPSPRQGVPSRARVEHEQAGNPGLGPLRDDLRQGPVLRSLASRMAPSRWSVRRLRPAPRPMAVRVWRRSTFGRPSDPRGIPRSINRGWDPDRPNRRSVALAPPASWPWNARRLAGPSPGP
jgi:hypothetical protein